MRIRQGCNLSGRFEGHEWHPQQLKIDIKAEGQEENHLREVEQNCCSNKSHENGFARPGEHSDDRHQSYSLTTHIPYLEKSREIIGRLL
jgi:hypothetical protein